MAEPPDRPRVTSLSPRRGVSHPSAPGTPPGGVMTHTITLGEYRSEECCLRTSNATQALVQLSDGTVLIVALAALAAL